MEVQAQAPTIPLAYIITCRTYATWLHGDKRESVDPKHNEFGTLKIKYDPDLENTMKSLCKEKPFLMNESQREIVLQSVINTCKFANWHLYAANIRSNHMHIVVRAPKEPVKVAI